MARMTVSFDPPLSFEEAEAWAPGAGHLMHVLVINQTLSKKANAPALLAAVYDRHPLLVKAAIAEHLGFHETAEWIRTTTPPVYDAAMSNVPVTDPAVDPDLDEPLVPAPDPDDDDDDTDPSPAPSFRIRGPSPVPDTDE